MYRLHLIHQVHQFLAAEFSEALPSGQLKATKLLLKLEYYLDYQADDRQAGG